MAKKNLSKVAGGKARSQALTSNERKEIASKAAKDKWSNLRAIYGSPDKKLTLGERKLNN